MPMHLSLESLISFDRIHSVAKDILSYFLSPGNKNHGNLIIFDVHIFFIAIVESRLIKTDRISFGNVVVRIMLIEC